MKVTVIGHYGGSAPTGGATSSYLIEVEDKKILLDCGAGSLNQLQKICDLNDINDVIITHYHYDHFSDLGTFVYNRLVRLNIGETANVLNIYGQDDGFFFNTFKMGNAVKLHPIDEETQLTIHGIKIDFLETVHPVKCLAIRMEYQGKTIVYTADTAFMPILVDFSREADLLIAECSLYSGFKGNRSGHMNTEDVAALINQANVKKCILTHLPIYGQPEKLLQVVKDLTTTDVVLASPLLAMDISK